MSNLVQWSATVAILVPIIVALLNQRNWSPQVKAFVFVVVSIIAAAITAYFQGDLTGHRWFESALVIVPAAAAFYHGFWKPSGIAPGIEKATSAPPPPKRE